MTKGKLVTNLRKAIGEPRWIAISGFTAVAAVTAISLIPDIVLAKRS